MKTFKIIIERLLHESHISYYMERYELCKQNDKIADIMHFNISFILSGKEKEKNAVRVQSLRKIYYVIYSVLPFVYYITSRGSF